MLQLFQLLFCKLHAEVQAIIVSCMHACVDEQCSVPGNDSWEQYLVGVNDHYMDEHGLWLPELTLPGFRYPTLGDFQGILMVQATTGKRKIAVLCTT